MLSKGLCSINNLTTWRPSPSVSPICFLVPLDTRSENNGGFSAGEVVGSAAKLGICRGTSEASFSIQSAGFMGEFGA